MVLLFLNSLAVQCNRLAWATRSSPKPLTPQRTQRSCFPRTNLCFSLHHNQHKHLSSGSLYHKQHKHTLSPLSCVWMWVGHMEPVILLYFCIFNHYYSTMVVEKPSPSAFVGRLEEVPGRSFCLFTSRLWERGGDVIGGRGWLVQVWWGAARRGSDKGGKASSLYSRHAVSCLHGQALQRLSFF